MLKILSAFSLEKIKAPSVKTGLLMETRANENPRMEVTVPTILVIRPIFTKKKNIFLQNISQNWFTTGANRTILYV